MYGVQPAGTISVRTGSGLQFVSEVRAASLSVKKMGMNFHWSIEGVGDLDLELLGLKQSREQNHMDRELHMDEFPVYLKEVDTQVRTDSKCQVM